MRSTSIGGSALAVVLLFCAAGPRSDQDRLQGHWELTALEINGEKAAEAQVVTGKLHVDGNRYTAEYEGKTYHETFKLEPEQSPKAVDFTYTDGPRKGETVKGIYKLDDDSYTMCRAILDDDDRPKTFATKANSGLFLVVWKRAKPQNSARP